MKIETIRYDFAEGTSRTVTREIDVEAITGRNALLQHIMSEIKSKEINHGTRRGSSQCGEAKGSTEQADG